MGSVEETCFYSDIIVISSNNLYGLTQEHLQTIMTKVEELFGCPLAETNRDDATKFMGPKGMRKSDEMVVQLQHPVFFGMHTVQRALIFAIIQTIYVEFPPNVKKFKNSCTVQGMHACTRQHLMDSSVIMYVRGASYAADIPLMVQLNDVIHHFNMLQLHDYDPSKIRVIVQIYSNAPYPNE